MKFIYAALLVALLSVGSAYAQQGSGVPPDDRSAFLQGQMDAQRADVTGTRLSAYCSGYASVITSEHALFMRGVGVYVAYPVECQQFWSYVDIYGPQFWYPRVYVGIYGSFGRNYGHWRTYDNRYTERRPPMERPGPRASAPHARDGARGPSASPRTARPRR
jgi:hypothetical protein